MLKGGAQLGIQPYHLSKGFGLVELITLGQGGVRHTTDNDVVERLSGYIVRCLLWIC
jgi:hypothetical protein